MDASDKDRNSAGRIEALEEAVAFGERRIARLDQTIQELSGVVHELARRLERAERRLEDLRTASGGQPPEPDAEETSSAG